MDKRQFDDLITRYRRGEATETERSLIEKWLRHRQELKLFEKLSASEKEKSRLRSFQKLSSRIKGVRPVMRRVFFYRAAAAIILVSLFSYSLLKINTSPVQEQRIGIVKAVSSGEEINKVILSDSTIIWLKGNSSISYPERFTGSNRHVSLVGEALFEVAKDPEHPFIIQCGTLTAEVLGTSFSISSRNSNTEVLVLTGQVALSSSGNTRSLIVHPNEKAVYNEKADLMQKLQANQADKTAKIQGTEYNMRFKGTALKEIVRRIEGKFSVRISLKDQRLNNCTITADFTDQSLDKTLSMIAETLGIEYEINDSQAMLKGTGCD